jgi:hypothetical protein
MNQMLRADPDMDANDTDSFNGNNAMVNLDDEMNVD